jgi:hypothetical protein
VQFVANYAFVAAQCDDPSARWQLPAHAWEIGLGAAGIAVALAAGTTSLTLYLRTARIDDIHHEVLRGQGGAPPQARIHFLAICGLVVNFLALTIMLMTAVGAPLLSLCQQS